jgi:hypothetical protein
MTNSFYVFYKAIFDELKKTLETKTDTIGPVSLGTPENIESTPMTVVNVEETNINPSEMAKSIIDVKINFSVILIMKPLEPKDWFTEIIAPMGDILDAVLTNPTLNGKVKDVTPTGFMPGEIKFNSRVLYGGIARFMGEAWFTP